jgi:hypothetical protein
MREHDFDDTTTEDQAASDTTSTSSPTTIDPFALYVRREGGGSFFDGDLVFFNGQTGKWSRGQEKNPVNTTAAFLINMHEIYVGWIRLVEDEKTRREIGRVIDGYQRLPRAALGDTDKRSWPHDRSGGDPQDPWKPVTYLCMRDEDGEPVVFGPFSMTARKAVADFVAIYCRQDRGGKFPVVLLESRSFKNQSGGLTYVPDFKIIDWKFWDGTPAPKVQPVALPSASSAPAAITARADIDMEDEIPF